MLKAKNKDKNLEAARRKLHVMIKGAPIRFIVAFSSETMEVRRQ